MDNAILMEGRNIARYLRPHLPSCVSVKFVIDPPEHAGEGWEDMSVTDTPVFFFAEHLPDGRLIVHMATATEKVYANRNASYMFSGMYDTRYIDARVIDFRYAIDYTGLFSDDVSLEKALVRLDEGDPAVSLASLFYNCRSMESFPYLRVTDRCISTERMFFGCGGLDCADFSGSDFSSVETADYMFGACGSLMDVTIASAAPRLFSARGMFEGCQALVSVDISAMSMENAVSFRGMFAGCSSLHKLHLGWNARSVVNMEGMFSYCSSIEDLDLSSFDFSGVRNMNMLFKQCSSLRRIAIGDVSFKSDVLCEDAVDGCSSLSFVSFIRIPDGFSVHDAERVFKGMKAITEIGLVRDSARPVNTEEPGSRQTSEMETEGISDAKPHLGYENFRQHNEDGFAQMNGGGVHDG